MHTGPFLLILRGASAEFRGRVGTKNSTSEDVLILTFHNVRHCKIVDRKLEYKCCCDRCSSIVCYACRRRKHKIEYDIGSKKIPIKSIVFKAHYGYK